MAIFETCLTNNSSPIHQENIILCALTDPYKPENRCKAVEAIKFIRAEIARKVAEARLSEQVDVGRVPMYKWGKLLPDRFLLPSARRQLTTNHFINLLFFTSVSSLSSKQKQIIASCALITLDSSVFCTPFCLVHLLESMKNRTIIASRMDNGHALFTQFHCSLSR